MKVKELIKKLSTLNQDQEIWLYDIETQEDYELKDVYKNEDESYTLI